MLGPPAAWARSPDAGSTSEETGRGELRELRKKWVKPGDPMTPCSERLIEKRVEAVAPEARRRKHRDQLGLLTIAGSPRPRSSSQLTGAHPWLHRAASNYKGLAGLAAADPEKGKPSHRKISG